VGGRGALPPTGVPRRRRRRRRRRTNRQSLDPSTPASKGLEVPKSESDFEGLYIR